MVRKWNIETDIVVVGYGLAGAISAIIAHDAGAKVLLVEKLRAPGGNSLLAGGAITWSRYLSGRSPRKGVGQLPRNPVVIR